MKEYLHTVSVVLVTYNQEKWIRQALESVVSQTTDYSFEVIVGDDCSSDATYAICQEYAEKYDFIHLISNKKNLGVVGNWLNCIKHASGKYIMNLGGDDYWHNPNKIQIQVDYMEAHPDCIVCHTDIDLLYDKTGKIEHSHKQSKGIAPPTGRIQKQILAGREHMNAVSICYRRDAFDKYIPKEKYIELEFPREDWPTLLILSAYGDIEYIPISTATYRVGQESISNTLDYDKIRRRYELDFRMTEFLYLMFPEWGPMDQGTTDYFKTFLYHSLLLAAYQNNDYKSARIFRRKDPRKKSKAYLMSLSWLTFKMYRWLFL